MTRRSSIGAGRTCSSWGAAYKMPKKKPVHLLVIDPFDALAHAVRLMRDAGFAVDVTEHASQIHPMIQEVLPACLIVPLELQGRDGDMPLVRELKNDSIYGHLPAITALPAERLEGLDWAELQADEFVILPCTDGEWLARVRICLARAQRDLNANPLTGLPGNIAIIREIEARLQRRDAFAVAYLDLDHFKPFNDKYGFLRGDEVLRMTARIVVNAARSIRGGASFVGHVGGDDFVLIAASDQIGAACDEITRNFDLLIPNFYDEEDRIRGAIHAIDRQGNATVFSLMTCSIAVVDTAAHTIRHVADISARAAQVKKYAKSIRGSATCYDRRT